MGTCRLLIDKFQIFTKASASVCQSLATAILPYPKQKIFTQRNLDNSGSWIHICATVVKHLSPGLHTDEIHALITKVIFILLDI